MMEKEWRIYAKKADFKHIAESFGIDQVTARVIRNRDVIGDEAIRMYLKGTAADLYDGKDLPDAEKALDLLMSAIRMGSRIRVVGDYDIDGVCASHIMLSALRACGALADHVIPDRIKDGYGINERIIREAFEDGIDLLVTVDNGIAAIEELRLAKELGLKVIVTDHHEVRTDAEERELLPPADSITDPKLSSSVYPEKDICGAVVAWKLCGLLLHAAGLGDELWIKLLPFAAIATVGDVMPLKGENRIIVREGLKAINSDVPGINMGLSMLIRACDMEGKKLTAYHIGFVIGPCINAGGRLESAEEAMKLFMSEDRNEAEALALHLKDLNDERKAMTEQGVKEALKKAEEEYGEDLVLVIELPKLHESLAGIVAGRIREKTGKPVFVLTDTDELGISKGSGRSVEAYHMFEGLQREQELLVRFGGHPMAAGLSLKTEDIPKLRKNLNEHSGLTPEKLIEKVWIDAAMPLDYLSEGLVSELSGLEPFGNGNERPLFARKDLKPYDLRVLGRNKNVLRFSLREEQGRGYEAVMFGDGQELMERLRSRDRISVLYSPRINEYNNTRQIQLNIIDFR